MWPAQRASTLAFEAADVTRVHILHSRMGKKLHEERFYLCDGKATNAMERAGDLWC